MTCACPPAAPSSAGRRRLLAGFAGAALACTALGRAARALDGAAPPHTTLTPDQALAALMEGNRRFLAGETPPGAFDAQRRALLATGQAPYAAILGCADSRAAPELLFHATLGQLFVVRNAGNIADNGAIGSLEYAVANLGVPLIMVLGHESCGAAAAAVTMAQNDAALPNHLRDMLLPMLPAALAATRAGGDLTEGTVLRNVARSCARLVDDSPVLAAAVSSGRLKIVGARYDLQTEAVAQLA